MIIPLFFIGEPDESTRLISMTIYAGLFLDVGIFSKNNPGMLLGFLSKSLPLLKNSVSLSSTMFSQDNLS